MKLISAVLVAAVAAAAIAVAAAATVTNKQAVAATVAADDAIGAQASAAGTNSSCENERRAAESLRARGLTGTYVPDCEQDGSWSALQCHTAIGLCHCRLPDGVRVTRPTRDPVYCNCPNLRYRAFNEDLFAGAIPSCARNSMFNPVQCYHQFCFCVDEISGEQVSESVHVRNMGSLPCRTLFDGLPNPTRSQ